MTKLPPNALRKSMTLSRVHSANISLVSSTSLCASNSDCCRSMYFLICFTDSLSRLSVIHKPQFFSARNRWDIGTKPSLLAISCNRQTSQSAELTWAARCDCSKLLVTGNCTCVLTVQGHQLLHQSEAHRWFPISDWLLCKLYLSLFLIYSAVYETKTTQRINDTPSNFTVKLAL